MRTLVALFLASVLGLAQHALERIPWSQSPDALAGYRVVVKLTDDTRVSGYWTSVTPNTFTMRVESTSNRRAFGKGVRKMPRASIVEVRAGERRVRGRAWGTVIGIYAFSIAAARTESPGLMIAAPFGGGVAGYYLGKSIDTATRLVTLVPDDPRPGDPPTS